MGHARALALLLLLSSAAVAGAETRYVETRDYEYGGGSLGDLPSWHGITWVWRSAADRDACQRSVFEDPTVRRSDPVGTPACTRARLASVRHRSLVDLAVPDPACGPLTTITFTPADGDRLTRLTGCITPARLSPSPLPREPGKWIFVVDVHEIAELAQPDLRRIGAYSSWKECEHVRRTVRDDLAKETDAEAADGTKLAAAGSCLPEEFLE
jgi:hypothetical protein